ncbi:MAG: ThuA domain-containing protein [Planctomycetes bacterium]|nr:ThuA domain-containing protein [Planctomycetota bacterium]
MKKALIVWGGWDGHEPKQVADIFRESLEDHDVEVEVSDTLDSFRDVEKLKKLDLIIPIWTMGSIEKEQLQPVLEAVSEGTGIAGVHGGMCDAFRQSVDWQYMTGGQWVAHPGGDGVEYVVKIVDNMHPITNGLKEIQVKSEKYYMHVDPAVHILAVTYFDDVAMPVAWTKAWGKGRVFYTSLGHVAKTAAQPDVRELTTRGFLWAAEKAE